MTGIIFQIIENPVWGIYYFLRNISVPVVLLYLLFQMRVLGAGDIKLFSVIGSYLTMQELFRCMVYSFFAAGAGAVLLLAADEQRWSRLKHAAEYLFAFVRTGKIKPYTPQDQTGQSTFAFSVPILMGTVLALFPFSGV